MHSLIGPWRKAGVLCSLEKLVLARRRRDTFFCYEGRKNSAQKQLGL